MNVVNLQDYINRTMNQVKQFQDLMNKEAEAESMKEMSIAISLTCDVLTLGLVSLQVGLLPRWTTIPVLFVAAVCFSLGWRYFLDYRKYRFAQMQARAEMNKLIASGVNAKVRAS